MSTLTPTIGLKKPDGSDPFLTDDFDHNYDLIDAAIKALQRQVAGGGAGSGSGAYLTQAAGDLRYIRTVNGTGPDGSGNVVVSGGTGGGGTTSTATTESLQDYLFAHQPFSDHEGHNFGASMAAGSSQMFTLCTTVIPANIGGRLSYDGAIQLGGGGSVGGTARITDTRISLYINGIAATIAGIGYRQYFPGLTNGGGYVQEMPFLSYRDVPASNVTQTLTLTCQVTQASGAGLVYAARTRALMAKT